MTSDHFQTVEPKPLLHLETPRLLLRPFREDDLEAFAAYRSDPQVARYQSWTAPYSLDQARAFLEEMTRTLPGTPGEWYQLAAERKAQPGLIGDCAFHILTEDETQAHIGYTFAPAFGRQGYATEAVRRLLDYLFADLRLRRVCAICDVANEPSYRLLERLGFRREAHHIEIVWFKGAWGSEYVYAMLNREWQQKRDPTGSSGPDT